MESQWSGTDTIKFHILSQTPVRKGTKRQTIPIRITYNWNTALNHQYKIINGCVCVCVGGGGALTRVHNPAIKNIHRQNLYATKIFPSDT